MSPFKKIASESSKAGGVRLVPPSPRWERAFLEAVRNSRELHHPWVQPPGSSEAFSAYLRRCDADHCVGFLVVDVRSGQLAGVVNINEIVRGAFQSAYLGYYAFAPFAAKGYMQAGLSKAITRGFGKLRLHRLEANIQPGNARSIGLVSGLGFRHEGMSPRYLKVRGRWRDHERWAILAEDWRRAPK